MHNELPLVSIVTPTYNQAEFLAETIDSVLAQTYENIEYIVINDGSTDSTEEVLRAYDGRINWRTQKNEGQAATLNRGWEFSRGEIIGYLSSDDTLEPQAVQILVDALRASDSVLVYPDYDLIDAQSKFLRRIEAPEYSEGELREYLICQPGPGAIFYKDAFDAVGGGWRQDLSQVPDYEFWLRLSMKGSFTRVPSALALSRVHDNSLSYRKLTVGKAREILSVVGEYYAQGQIGRIGMSYAYLLAYRNLIRSGHWRDALVDISKGVSLWPKIVTHKRFIRIFVSAMLGKIYYGVFAALKSKER